MIFEEKHLPEELLEPKIIRWEWKEMWMFVEKHQRMVQLKAAYEWYIKKKKTTEEQKNGEKDLYLERVQEDQDEVQEISRFQTGKDL